MGKPVEGAPAKPAKKRVYVIFVSGVPVKLIRASSKAQSIRASVAKTHEAIVADQEHLISLLGKGMKIEDAKEENEDGNGAT